MTAPAEERIRVEHPGTPNPLVLESQMAEIYERFVRTSYGLAADQLAAERAAGLRGQLASETLIEPLPRYRSSSLDAYSALAGLELGLGAEFDQAAGELLDGLME